MQVLPCLSAGGAETMVAELSIALARASLARVHVTSFFPSRPTLPERLFEAGVSYEDLAKRHGPDPAVLARLQRSMARFRPDVLHSHQYVLPYLTPLLLMHPRLRCFHTIHTLPRNETTRSRRLLQRLLFHARVYPVAINDVIASLARFEYGLAQIPTVPNGIDLEPFLHAFDATPWRVRNSIPPRATVITCLAHLRPEKNHSLLLQAFARLTPECPGAILLLVGDGPLRQQLQSAVTALRLDESVRFLGFRDDVPDILAASDLGVLSSRYEGMPISVMQMMASALPVVATSVGGLTALIQPGVTGTLVPPADPGALAGALRRLVLDPAERARLGANARNRASAEFSARYMAESYARLYLSPLRRSLPTPTEVGPRMA